MQFYVPIPKKNLRVSVFSFLPLWVIYYLCMFVIIYYTFLGCPLSIFLDYIGVLCRGPVVFRGCWIINGPEIVIFGFGIDFILVFLHPISKYYIVSTWNLHNTLIESSRFTRVSGQKLRGSPN